MRNIIITGASSGIGKGLKDYFLKKGDRVINISLDQADYNLDVTNRSAMEKAFEDIKQKYKNIDIVIPCAGFGISGAVELIPAEKVQKEYDVNIMGTINTVQLAIPLMQNQGKIILISSATALFPLPFRAFYCSSKAAVSMLSDCLRMELANTQIQVCQICPCDIKTEFTANRVKDFQTNQRYGKSIQLSAQKIDNAQDKRMPLDKAIRILTKIIEKKHLKPQYVMGARNKFCYFLQKFFPRSWFLAVLKKIFFIKEPKTLNSKSGR